jgi:methanogenic corrinoid protein MtbC1
MGSRKTTTVRSDAVDEGAWLSIGALSRATGIAVETLRTWETRYGFPVPKRKPSGHRVYPLGAVPRLRRIADALALGHRAGQVVGASEAALEDLLGSIARSEPPPSVGVPPAEDLPGLLRLVRRFDAERLSHTLLGDWSRMTPIDFLVDRIAPLVEAVGDGWASGELEIRHEHFVSERVGDLLRSLRLPFEERAGGPLVIFATLPGEGHGLGLQMAALLLSSTGCRVLNLGTEVPSAQLTSLASDLGARAVALSVSSSGKGHASLSAIRKLREDLPRKVALLVGGSGAPPPPEGVDTVGSLRDLEGWGARLQAGRAGRASKRGPGVPRRT